jgi:hypothetical protein
MHENLMEARRLGNRWRMISIAGTARWRVLSGMLILVRTGLFERAAALDKPVA